MPNFSNDQGQRAGNMSKGECCSDFGERVHQFIIEKFSVTEGPLEA